MRSTLSILFCLAITATSVLDITGTLFAEPAAVEKGETNQADKAEAVPSATKKKSTQQQLVSVKEARDRAKLTHHIYETTLEAMHHYYFFNDRSSVPARVMEDMFKDIERQENIKAKWIAVNAKVMSIDHKPEGDFEKQAVKEISAGKYEYERVEKGLYRRAVAISLNSNGCLGCHLGFGANKNKKKRFAGLVLTIPVKEE